jgi:protease I
MKKILMVIAQTGFRDEELVVPKEVFEKAGLKVMVASISRTKATGSRGASVAPDLAVHEANPDYFDALIIVGGPGSPALAEDKDVLSLIRRAEEKGKVVGAICLGPMALAIAGILRDKNATVFPDREAMRVLRDSGAHHLDHAVVRSGRIVTANGPDSAGGFAEKILECLAGE